jgi:diguanylate cyclase (GGDEF)-like protein/PAS domain S-box-containing protein
LLIAGVLFAGVFALRLAVSDPDEPVSVLYVLPVALVAIEFGVAGGLAAATLSIALVVTWRVAKDADIGVFGYATRTTAFFLLAALVGTLSRQRSALERASTRQFEISPDLTCTAGFDGYFKRVNPAFTRTLGYTEQELLSRPFAEFVHPDDREPTQAGFARLAEPGNGTAQCENRYRTKAGEYRWLEWSSRADNSEGLTYAAARDITDRKLAEEALRAAERERTRLLARVQEIARTDELTGLPNRRAWEEELARELARARRSARPLCVAMLDLDHFKGFNDQRGHQAGDELLRDAAGAWAASVRVTDFIVRYGGEEFALLLPECPTEQGVEVLERLRAATPMDQTCSAGVACWDGSESGEELLRRADFALYEAKRAGRDRVAVA